MPTAFTSLFIIDSYESVGSFADARDFGFGTFSFKPSVFGTPLTAPLIGVLSSLAHLSSLVSNRQRGAKARAHLGPVSDLIVVSGRVAEQSARHPSLSLLSGFGLILLSKPTMLPCC